MPKESKKFINPLLRPSQPVESRKETPVEFDEPSVVEPPVPARKSSARIVQDVEESALPTTPVIPPVSTQDILSSVKKEVTPLPASLPTSDQKDNTFPSSSSVPSTVPVTYTSMPISVPKEDQHETMVSQHLATPIHTPPVPTVPSTVDDGTASSQPVSVGSRRSPVETYTETKTSTFPSEPLVVQTQSVTEDMHALDSLPSGQDESSYRGNGIVRRKRGAQAFEKTHERITLWVDKHLKQAFEELAYEQETSKTSLLNEALADLLRKYSSQS